MQGFRSRRLGQRKRMPVGHDEVAHGHICEIHPEEGFGRIETHDGRVLYFYKESVQNHPFEKLVPGTEVRFATRASDPPLRANVVQIIG